MMTLRLTGFLLLFCIVFQQSHADESQAEGTALNGKALAELHCSRCHNVEPNGPFKLHPPSFSSIAVYRTAEQIRGRILFPPIHSTMPQLVYYLMPENVDHLVAYILSLESQK